MNDRKMIVDMGYFSTDFDGTEHTCLYACDLDDASTLDEALSSFKAQIAHYLSCLRFKNTKEFEFYLAVDEYETADACYSREDGEWVCKWFDVDPEIEALLP